MVKYNTEIEVPPILTTPWDVLGDAEAQIRHILVNWQEFYAISYGGNLLFTPEEISAAHLRFIHWSSVK